MFLCDEHERTHWGNRKGHMRTSFLKVPPGMIRWVTLRNVFERDPNLSLSGDHQSFSQWHDECHYSKGKFTSSMVKQSHSMKTMWTTTKSHLSFSLGSRGCYQIYSEEFFNKLFKGQKCDAMKFLMFLFFICLLSSPRLNLRRLPISLPFRSLSTCLWLYCCFTCLNYFSFLVSFRLVSVRRKITWES